MLSLTVMWALLKFQRFHWLKYQNADFDETCMVDCEGKAQNVEISTF